MEETHPFKGLLDVESSTHSELRYTFLEGMFQDGLGVHRWRTNVVSIFTNNFENESGSSLFEDFKKSKKAVAMKRPLRTPNLRFAWYAGTLSEIAEIIRNGFKMYSRSENGVYNGIGLYLTPAEFSVDSALLAIPDENGVSYLLLCEVILGDPELVESGSIQSHPSSDRYDIGVDHLTQPRRYIVWGKKMNSNVSPKFVIGFRLPNGVAPRRIEVPPPATVSIGTKLLFSMLSTFVPGYLLQSWPPMN